MKVFFFHLNQVFIIQ